MDGAGEKNTISDKVVLSSTGIAALALGIGAGVSPAHAGLVVTPFTSAEKTAFLTGTTVDFGPGGSSDFGVGALIASGDSIVGIKGNTPSAMVAIKSASCTTCFLQPIPPGHSVDGSLSYATSGVKFFALKGSDFPDGNYYFGLEDQFGWIEINSTGGLPTLIEYAFESVPGVPAPVPSVPEPGSLPLFAVGAAAVLAMRRGLRAA